jgi:DNA repair protein RecO (recombination protein O)
MAQYMTEAIILGVRNWGDADKMLTILTKERGKIKAAAFGCRRPKSPLAAGMQMFNHLDLQLTEGQRIDTVRQYELRQNFRIMSEDLSAMAYGAFVAELVTELCNEHEPQPQIFDKLLQIFSFFGKRNPRLVALAAGYQLLEYTGSQLHFSNCARCEKELVGDVFFSIKQGGAVCRDCRAEGMEPFSAELRSFIEQLILLDWAQPPSFRVTGRNLVRAEHLLLIYLQQLLEKQLRSLTFIQQLPATE